MTTGQQLDSISTVSNVSALTHLLNPNDAFGVKSTVLVPYDDLLLDIQIDRMSIDMQNKALAVEVQTKEINAELGTKTLSIDIQNKNKEIDNGCS